MFDLTLLTGPTSGSYYAYRGSILQDAPVRLLLFPGYRPCHFCYNRLLRLQPESQLQESSCQNIFEVCLPIFFLSLRLKNL